MASVNQIDSEKNLSISYIRVAHLHAFCKYQYHVGRCIERIFQKEEFDINCDMKKCNNVSENQSKYFSLLHSAYYQDPSQRYYLLKVYKLFLNHGVDYTATDSENRTIIHRAIHDYEGRQPDDLEDFHKYVNPILSAHIEFNNISNPRCKYGISHFHGACMANNLEAIEFYLNNGVDIDESVNKDSPILAGFTGLHFAAEYLNFRAAEILLNRGTNLKLKNKAGMTAVHMLMEQKINEKYANKITDDTRTRDAIIKLLMKFNEKTVDDFGLSHFHVACLLNDTSVVESILDDQSIDVNQAVNLNSPFYRGYTPLHFAAVSSKVDTVKLLLKNGANLEAKNGINVTPLDICLQNQIVDILYIIQSQPTWTEIILSDNKTYLMDLLSKMESEEYLGNIESIKDLIIPMDSILWPGYTILHLAVMLVKKANENDLSEWIHETNIVGKIVAKGVDITKKDANNRTALHLAFYLEKRHAVKMLLKHHLTSENPIDDNNLSHFHIACTVGDKNAVKRFLTNENIDVNLSIRSTMSWEIEPSKNSRGKFFLTPGSTALHISIASGNVEITKILLDNGANIYAKDRHGTTPIHRLFTITTYDSTERLIKLLSNRDVKFRDLITDFGLSHLHVACYYNCYSAVKKLLDCGANTNAIILSPLNGNYEDPGYFSPGYEVNNCWIDPYGDPSEEPFFFLRHFNGSNVSHFAIHSMCLDYRILLLLMLHGVEFANCKCKRRIEEYKVLPYLLQNNNASDRLKSQLRISSLHVACYAKKLELIENFLLKGEDVNAKSSISPGNTPLHVAIIYSKNSKDLTELVALLLENGADVTLKNDNGDTALRLLYDKYQDQFEDCKSAHLLLKSIKNLKVTNLDSRGLSFFHYACMLKDIEVIEKFLENGIDVNQTVDYLADKYPGYSPLHFASSQSFKDVNLQLRIIDLLIENGADVRIKDIFENTLLHSAVNCGSSRHIIFDRLVRDGADVNAENFDGQTPLELLISSRNTNWKEVQCLLKHGCHVKFYNPVSKKRYIDKLFYRPHRPDYRFITTNSEHDSIDDKVLDNEIFRNLINSEYVSRIDENGRNFIQNFVSLETVNDSEYFEIIRRLVKRGCDVNHRDNEGRTVLHLAACYRYNQGVLALLKNGADVNITDKEGKTAFAYCFEDRDFFLQDRNSRNVCNTFVVHLYKMKRCGLYISESNPKFEIDADMFDLSRFEKDVERTKSIKIGSLAITLYDFSFEMDAEMIYPSMSISVRLEIDQFFETISQQQLRELDYLLKIKYEKARERLRLINLAIEPLTIVLKNQLPDICCLVILRYLPSDDLKNVIATQDL